VPNCGQEEETIKPNEHSFGKKKPNYPAGFMNQTTTETADSQPSGKKKKNRRRLIQRVLNGEFLAREGLINHLPFIAFLAGLFLLHISLMYYFEYTQSALATKNTELNEIRSSYNTTMSELERKRQQSSVAENIRALGLNELRNPPMVIDIRKGFLSLK